MNETELKNETGQQPATAGSVRLGRRLALMLSLLSLVPLVWTTYLFVTSPAPRSEFLEATPSLDSRTAILEKADEMAGDLQLHPELKTFDDDWYFEFIRGQITDEQDATQFADLHDKLNFAYQRQFETHKMFAMYGLAVSLICFVLALAMWLKPWAPMSLFLLAATLGSAPPITEFFIERDLGLSGLLWSLPAIALAVGILITVIRNLSIWRQRELYPWQSILLGAFLIGVGVVWVSLTYNLPSQQRAISRFGVAHHPSHAGLTVIIGGVMLTGIGIYSTCRRLFKSFH